MEGCMKIPNEVKGIWNSSEDLITPFAQGNRSVLSKSEKRLEIRAGRPELQPGPRWPPVSTSDRRSWRWQTRNEIHFLGVGEGRACEMLKGLVIIPEQIVRQLAMFEAWPVCRLRWILSQIWGEKEAVKCKIERWSHSPAEDGADRVLGTVLHPDSGRHGGSFRASSPTFLCLSGRTLVHSPFLSFHLLPTLPG